MANRFFLVVSMFIVVCQDIIEKAIRSDGIDKKYAVDTLKKVLLSVKWRKHIVFAPDLKEKDIECLDNLLTEEEVNLLKFVHSKRLNLNSLMNKLSILAQITFEEPTRKDVRTIYINPLNNQSFELFEETHFIVENILDSQFYSKVICNYYQRKNKLHTAYYSTAYYPVQGGGVTISDVLKFEIELNQHFCLVIGDSDKKSIGCRTEGETAKGIRSVVKEYEDRDRQKPFNVDYYIMSKTREIENLIPLCILDIFSNKRQRDFLNRHNDNLAYFDFKVGMEYKILYDNDVYNGWKTVFPDIIRWEQIDELKANTESQAEFENRLREQELPKLIDEWGKNILSKVLYPPTKKQKEAIYKLYEIDEKDLTPRQKDEWDIIGRNVFSWCCCFTNPPR